MPKHRLENSHSERPLKRSRRLQEKNENIKNAQHINSSSADAPDFELIASSDSDSEITYVRVDLERDQLRSFNLYNRNQSVYPPRPSRPTEQLPTDVLVDPPKDLQDFAQSISFEDIRGVSICTYYVSIDTMYTCIYLYPFITFIGSRERSICTSLHLKSSSCITIPSIRYHLIEYNNVSLVRYLEPL